MMATLSEAPVRTAPPPLRRELIAGGVCVLTFDRPESAANIFDQAALEALDEQIAFACENPDLKGLVLASAKPAIFIAGADLHTLARFLGRNDPDAAARLREMIEYGQGVFNRLAALPIPTVAAIHGACLGGGFELCLACDHRIASADRATKLGLPESQLGLLPAWGGSTRLPRLIGLPGALDLILTGRTLAAKQALRLGVVDQVVPRERLLEAAGQLIAKTGGRGPKRQRPRTATVLATNNFLAARAIALRVRPQLLRKTGGHYPAVLKALEVVTRGIARTAAESLALERDGFIELARTGTARNLVRLFFLQERARKLSLDSAAPNLGVETGPAEAAAPANPPAPIQRAAVIGAGVMGAGIAQWLAARGVPVILRDIDSSQVAKGMATIGRLFGDGVKRRLFTPLEARQAFDRIQPAATEVPLQRADLVIEAAVERMDLKKKIFGRLAAEAGPDTILASNTSALSITELSSATTAPDRVVGMHFFNPVHRMQLVEIVAGARTGRAALRRTLRFVQQIGKLPVLVRDSPGFVVNRILMPYLIEAGARIEDIDEAMVDFGMPMGPLRLIDEVGVDVAHHVARTLAGQFSDRLQVPEVLGRMLEAGLLGRKSGRGFYLHQRKRPRVNRAVLVQRKGDTAARLSRAELQQWMVLLMVNEAARCLEEEVVSAPEDVDFAMVMGTGFAPFRGGPLRHADAVGLPEVVARMNQLVGIGLNYFKPCALLAERASANRTFYGNERDEP
jgi:3-hydroxyacyl-CoA dehydrogenase/enoyl-CoA hydratase/3-hydroxybutyryl-CoA epimerase